MNSRKLHVPRYRGQATEPMGLYVAEDDHDRVVALLTAENARLQADSKRLAELDDQTIKQLGDRLRESQAELAKARELLQYAYNHSELLPNEREVDAFLIAHQAAPAAKDETIERPDNCSASHLDSNCNWCRG